MIKSRLFLRNLVKGARNSFLVLLFICAGCSSSTAPTFHFKNIVESIQNICLQEYKINVIVKLVGKTIWIYLPLEDLVEKADKPEKYTERFEISENNAYFKDGWFKSEYGIKVIPQKESTQSIKYNSKAAEDINKILRVLRRIIFSMEDNRMSPQFFYLIAADIKNGFEIKEVFYYLDLKKVTYDFISFTEFQHRNVQDMDVSDDIIADKEGKHIKYKDIGMNEFIALQIQQRIKMKFQKPEVEPNADIDKEVKKVVSYTLSTYGIKDFDGVELNNLLTGKKSELNSLAIRANPSE